MNRDNGFDRAQREYENQLPDDNDLCSRCECQSDGLHEVKFGRKYEYVCEACYIYYMEHGFLNRGED